MSGNFDHGLDLEVHTDPLGFTYGSNCTGPTPELRYLDDIRATLLDPECTGPDIAYAIVMDIAPESVRDDLRRRNLCFGVVTYAAGRLGREPVRSQGHVHKRSPHTGISTPEVYEVWSGRAVILMQEHAAEDPGRCFAVAAEAGDVVVVPPGWVHATISADPTVPLIAGGRRPGLLFRNGGIFKDQLRRIGLLLRFGCLVELAARGKETAERRPHAAL
ncbi:MAG: glucose-6-phosphate isomerase, partial [Actinobacteria bacterium]|nr:glucose-6-phosphate isomerase [Actinomycetota bacterium]